MPVEVVPTDADFEVALGKRFMCGAGAWAQLKGEAVRFAAERLLQANLAAQRELVAKLPDLTGVAWMAEQERFDLLLKQHDELSRIAFPASFTEVSGG
jgi:hypothetical protein